MDNDDTNDGGGLIDDLLDGTEGGAAFLADGERAEGPDESPALSEDDLDSIFDDFTDAPAKPRAAAANATPDSQGDEPEKAGTTAPATTTPAATGSEDGDAGDETTDAAPDLRAVLRPIGDVAGTVFESAEDVVEHVRALRNTVDGYAELRGMVETVPGFATFVARLIDGASPADAAEEAFDGVTVDLDPLSDPEAYARREARKAEDRVRAEFAAKEAERAAAAERRAAEDVTRLFDAFTKRHNMTPEEVDAYRADFASIVAGDPTTGRRRSDMFDVVRNGLRYDADVRAAREAGIVQGRNEALRSVKQTRSGRGGDSLPLLTGGDAAPAPRVSESDAALDTGRRRTSRADVF